MSDEHSNYAKAAAPSPATAPVLEYARPIGVAPVGPRPWWVHAIVALYLLLWAFILTLPLWAVAERDTLLPVSIFSGSMVLCGMALMILPVRSVRRRPVTRRTIWLPIIASGFMTAVLVTGAGLALLEYFKSDNTAGWLVTMAALAVWIGWSVLFATIGFSTGPMTLGVKLHRALIAGSVLELLVAVPTHVVVRRRPECCAGIGTGIGICLGVAVMFVSFGPSVLLLFHRRRKQISNAARTPEGQRF